MATAALLADAVELADVDIRQPSLLPGCTRAHVLSHLADNGDGATRLLRSALTSIPDVEYASVAARNAAIEEGACRPAIELQGHLRASATAFDDACAQMTSTAWSREISWTTGQRTPAHVVPWSRLSEVLVHHVDLSVGYLPSAWPADWVHERVAAVVAALNRRQVMPEPLRIKATDTGVNLDLGRSPTRTVQGPQARLLAWLLGRSDGEDLILSGGCHLPAVPTTYTT
jgi:maleylpyruvate isomerase